MAGERIVEALELADNECKVFADYEEAMAKLDKNDAMRLQAPPRNPILAAYNLEPEAYVLRVVEKVPSSALHDALLVLPFQKVVSLMKYLDIWTRNVSIFVKCTFLEASFPVSNGILSSYHVQYFSYYGHTTTKLWRTRL